MFCYCWNVTVPLNSFTECHCKHESSYLKHWCVKCWMYAGIICYRWGEPARWFCPAAGEPPAASPAAAVLFCSTVRTHSCADSRTVGCTVRFLQRCSTCYRCNRHTFSGMTSHTHTHARAHTHIHARARTLSLSLSLSLSFSLSLSLSLCGWVLCVMPVQC
jgi:hypothetical protein